MSQDSLMRGLEAGGGVLPGPTDLSTMSRGGMLQVQAGQQKQNFYPLGLGVASDIGGCLCELKLDGVGPVNNRPSTVLPGET